MEPEKEIVVRAEGVAELSQEMGKDSYLIKYASGEKGVLVSELENIGCTDVKNLDFANCVVVSLSPPQLKAIKTLDCATQVERDYDYRCLWHGGRNKELAKELAGENPNIKRTKTVKLALLDTGVLHLPTAGTVRFVDNTTEEENGHGTQMAGIVSSVISDAENRVAQPYIYSVVVADHRGFAKTSTIMEALNWAMDNDIKIISMSFGDYHKSALLEEMINRAASFGIVMVAAVGNDGGFKDESRIMYPAAFANVLSVGAKNGETVATYSNGGIGADCFASGTQILKDANGNQVSVIGTSGAAAFVAGMIFKKWCIDPDKRASDIAKCIKKEMLIACEDNAGGLLTDTADYDTLTKTEESVVSTANVGTLAETNGAASVRRIAEDSDSGCSSNDMESAISLPFLSWTRGSIECPGEEVWYKFTANASGVHPNGSSGWYTVHTGGALDTVGYLYDSNGNQVAYNDDKGSDLNFSFWVQLDFCETYYIRMKAYGDNTGDFSIRVSYMSDDHGNTMETATPVSSVYYEDKSVTGYLHSQGDVDYYTFIPARNCVMEIYTEGDTDTYGQLYCGSGSLLYADNNSNGNGNFKITAHLEAMKWYYIAVSHNSATGYGDYTLRFKFVKDYCNQLVDEQYRVMYWYADNQDEYPEMGNAITRSMVYVSNRAKAEFEDRVILDDYNQKGGLRAVLDNGTFQDIFNYLLDSLISSIPLIGSSLSYAFNVGSILYDFMSSLDLEIYREKKRAIENTNQYIIGEHYWFTDYPNGMATGSYNTYSIGSGTYYGKEYQRGEFIEAYIKY